MKHILVVDDAKISLMSVRNALADTYRITAVTDGKQALMFFSGGNTCDLILLDYEMPNMSGLEVFENLRKNPNTKDIPVIFLTGNNHFSDVVKALELKPAGYLLKPVGSDELKQRVEEILE